MRKMNLNRTNKKKVRGIKRKSKAMIKSIEQLTEIFPEVNLNSRYWHMHLPVRQDFIDSKKTPSKVKKLCIQTMIDRVQQMVTIKPNFSIRIRIVACLNLTSLWDSQIIIFFGDDYFQNFFNRNDIYQRWIELPTKRNLCKELNLNIPTELTIKGFKEKIREDDYEKNSELWFVGELS